VLFAQDSNCRKVHPPLACKIAQRRDIENLSARIAIERQLVRKWGGCNRPIAWREISKKPCGVISLQMGNPHWLCFLRQAADDDPKQVPVASSVEPARNAIVEFVSSQVSLATDAREHIAGSCAHAIGKPERRTGYRGNAVFLGESGAK